MLFSGKHWKKSSKFICVKQIVQFISAESCRKFSFCPRCRHWILYWFTVSLNGFKTYSVSIKQNRTFRHSSSKDIELLWWLFFFKRMETSAGKRFSWSWSNSNCFKLNATYQVIDNKAKGRISKRVFQEARQISYPLIHTCTLSFQENVVENLQLNLQ